MLPPDARLQWPDPATAEPLTLPAKVAEREAYTIRLDGQTRMASGQAVELHRYPPGQTPPGASENPGYAFNAITVVGPGVLILDDCSFQYGGHALRIVDGARVLAHDCEFDDQAYDAISRYGSGGQVGLYGCVIENCGIDYPTDDEGSGRKASMAHALYARGPAPTEMLDCGPYSIQGWAAQYKNENGTGTAGPHRMERCHVHNAYGSVYAYQHVNIHVDNVEQHGGKRTFVGRAHTGFVHITRHVTEAEARGTVRTVEHFKTGVRGVVPWAQRAPAVTLVVPNTVERIRHRYGVDMTPGSGMDGDQVRELDPNGLPLPDDITLVKVVYATPAPQPVPQPEPQPPPEEPMETQTYILSSSPSGVLWILPVSLAQADIDRGAWAAYDKGDDGQVVAREVNVVANGATIGSTSPLNRVGGSFKAWAAAGERECATTKAVDVLSLTLTGTDLPEPLPVPEPEPDPEPEPQPPEEPTLTEIDAALSRLRAGVVDAVRAYRVESAEWEPQPEVTVAVDVFDDTIDVQAILVNRNRRIGEVG